MRELEENKEKGDFGEWKRVNFRGRKNLENFTTKSMKMNKTETRKEEERRGKGET